MDPTSREASLLAAAQEALAAFPITARGLTLFSESENITFLCEDGDSQQKFALRLHRPGYNSLEELLSERAWTQALGKSGVSVQRSVSAGTGGPFVQVFVGAFDEVRYAGLTHWLPGEPLGSVLETLAPDQQAATRLVAFEQIGQLAAKMHNQVVNWTPPTTFTRPYLGITGLLGEAPRWGRFWEHPDLSAEEQQQLDAVRAPLVRRLADYGVTDDNFGLIHADLHPDNVINHQGVLSVIDFDDCAFGWFGYDVATALLEYCDDDDFDDLRNSLLSSYRRVRPFSQQDEDMLDTFLLLRGLATLGWFAARPEHAGSDYFKTIRAWTLTQCEQLTA